MFYIDVRLLYMVVPVEVLFILRFGVLGSEDPAKKVQTYKTVVGIVTGNYDDNKTVATRIIPEILQFAYDNKYL